jgi:hypothetical protein
VGDVDRQVQTRMVSFSSVVKRNNHIYIQKITRKRGEGGGRNSFSTFFIVTYLNYFLESSVYKN